MVVGGGFEPPKGCPSRFTVCPRWPLGYPTDFVKRGKLVSPSLFAKSFFEENQWRRMGTVFRSMIILQPGGQAFFFFKPYAAS